MFDRAVTEFFDGLDQCKNVFSVEIHFTKNVSKKMKLSKGRLFKG